MAQDIEFSIKFIDPHLKSDDVATEVHYLIEDLRDLDDMSQVRFEPILEIRDVAEIRAGVTFMAHSDLLGPILRRLRDRLYYSPIQTAFSFKLDGITLRIETHQADDLVGFMAAAQSGLLFFPERDYLAEAETYSRTQGELSPTELDNLNLLRQRLGLTAEEAEVLNARAASPYPTKAEKHRHFEDITAAEFSRLRAMGEGPPFAHKEIWPVLQELAENLGLPTLEAEAIYQTYQQRYDDDTRLKTELSTAKTAEDASLAAAAKAEIDRQKQAQQVQERLNQYRDLCRQAMANSIYPSEFDQGRLDQARRLWSIDVEQAMKLEAEVRDELYGSVESAAGVDYSRLRGLLHQQTWHEADMETEVVILKALNLDMQPVTAATVQRLSPIDIATIDGLWSRYSKGRFGFKAQQQVYRAQQQIQPDDRQRWSAFEQALGWRKAPSLFSRGYKPYHDLNFISEAPQGHLPTWRWCCPSLSDRYKIDPEVMAAIMQHLNDGMPLEAIAVPALDTALPTQLA
ncbi:GUN4 domain-containing protein [Nodosilinea sp. LEGE 07298]|uniref:GUN4 domain-containing protein n=1 Tax=Nodosilinea sp. LEGE 07298 TaxID=2777970 RepID=UPI0018815BFA|nr:GUN4 domain-containing protein [Nodosilinea sp. LEGE 07298]MBE9109720.1 GUN4 domain-containing protein [Nodosilinea sp. LEGE 07298]